MGCWAKDHISFGFSILLWMQDLFLGADLQSFKCTLVNERAWSVLGEGGGEQFKPQLRFRVTKVTVRADGSDAVSWPTKRSTKKISWKRQKCTELKTKILSLTLDEHVTLKCEYDRKDCNQNDCSHSWNYNNFNPFGFSMDFLSLQTHMNLTDYVCI